MILDYGIAHCPVNWKVKEKTAPGFSRLYYVKGGEASYKDIYGNVILRDRYLYIMPTALAYNIRHNPDNKLFCVYLHMEFFPEYLTSIHEINAADDPVLFNLLETLTECIGKDSRSLISLLAEALVLYCREERLITFTEGVLTPLLLYISENLNQDLTIDDLSRRAGYNSQYFIRLFRDELGTTPYQYIIARRMERARTLLRTEKSISEISELTGFGDVKSFSRAFRKFNNLSPSDYRKNPFRDP